MKTDVLIDLLARDAKPPRFRFATIFAAAVLTGAVIAAAVMLATIGIRPDAVTAMDSARFVFKLVLMAALAVGAVGAAFRIGHPDMAVGGWVVALGAVPAGLAVAVALELQSVPSNLWAARLIGDNASFCLRMIPLLAIGPFAVLIAAMRQGAPSRPGVAGALAGLAAGGIAATVYAIHCDDDSALFVATWYPLAILAIVVVGWGVGKRLLTW